MTKLCPRGKAAAKRKFKVYPSAYANAYASKICAGKIKDPSGVKRKDFRGPKPSKAMGGRIFKQEGGSVKSRETLKKISKAAGKLGPAGLAMDAVKKIKKPANPGREGTKREPTQAEVDARRAQRNRMRLEKAKAEKRGPFRTVPGRQKGLAKPKDKSEFQKRRQPVRGMMGGGMMQMPRAMYKKGGKSFPDLSGDGKVTMKDILMGRGVIQRPKKKGGGLMEATSRLRAQGLKKGGIARGCGAVMSDRRKKTKMY
jgi:hypothetical protein